MHVSRVTGGALFAMLFMFAGSGYAGGEFGREFSLRSTEDKTVTLSGQKGKVVFLDFWATWCPPCRSSIPAVEKLHEELKDEGVVVLGINIEGDAAGTRRFAARNGMRYPVLIGDQKIAGDYRVTGIPAFFIIGPEGEIVKRYVGYQPGMEDEWVREIRNLLKTESDVTGSRKISPGKKPASPGK